MSFLNKKLILINSIFILSSCTNNNFHYDVVNNNLNIPVMSLDITPVLDLENVEKYDTNTLIPPVIAKDTEHPIVMDIQSKLMLLGYMEEDKPTTLFGDSTEEAIKKFQRQMNLKMDGIVTSKVYDLLMSDKAETYSVKRGDKGDDIKILQQSLYELNYLMDENDINGYFGEKTENAVFFLQRSNDVKPTGIIDLSTLNLLHSENVKAYTIDKNAPSYIIQKYQERLYELGYYFGEFNGVYTNAFREAVKQYQINNSQIVDGLIGPSTKFSLDSSYAKPYIIYLFQNSSDVKPIQKRLVELNYIEDRMITGYYGEFTAQSIALFQKNNNLPITGNVDGATRLILFSDTAVPSTQGPVKFSKQFIMDTKSIKTVSTLYENMGNVDDLIKIALLKLGCKYVWAAKGPNTFDCSGFVYWCLRQVGVNVTYMTTYNWRFSTQFERVEKFSDLEVGDLIIVNGHMGIVAENQTVIDASSSNGKVVHRDLDEWWSERFIIGFRIFNQNSEET